MKIYDYIVIGGGPAGVFSAIYAGSYGIKTVIIEKNEKIGNKLRISGSGQCNITHTGTPKDFISKYPPNGKFLKTAIYKYSATDLKKFFRKNNLELIEREDGKLFPISKKSEDIIKLMYTLCQKFSVTIIKNCEVLSVLHRDKFFLKTNLGDYISKNILIATGGITFPQTGSNGMGYLLAKSFGHHIIKPHPCLTPLYIKEYPFGELSGLSFKNIAINFYKNNKKIASSKGDVLFTHQNLSGPGILDNSRNVKIGDKISLNFINKSFELLKNEFIKYSSIHGDHSVKTFLTLYELPKRFIKNICFQSNILENLKISNINKKTRDHLCSLITEYRYEITKLGGINIGMATKGGVSLDEINKKTMESKLVKGLYFAGEVMDIDGNTGGYNIQAAISTGVLAARSIKYNP